MKKILAAFLTLAAVSVFPSVLRAEFDDEPQSEPEIIYAAWEYSAPDDEKEPTADYVCVQLADCPKFTRLVKGQMNWSGCLNIPLYGCTGECAMCSGSTNPAKLCKRRAGETCDPLIGDGDPVKCGDKILGTCDSAGLTVSANGCGCLFSTLTPGTLPCNVNNCI